MKLYSFVITSDRTGTVLDFGTYHHRQCAIDTANESPHAAPYRRVTVINHDTDGGHVACDSWVIPLIVVVSEDPEVHGPGGAV